MQFSAPEKQGSILKGLTISIINCSFHYTHFCCKISATVAAKSSSLQWVVLPLVVNLSQVNDRNAEQSTVGLGDVFLLRILPFSAGMGPITFCQL